ncbi:MAG: hypothetical protein GY757_16455, partial [bacterium]|nr:hypothetical protein [bacterium]
MTENKHDEIVESLLKVLEPLNGELRLFGRVCDPAIGNASNKEVFFFIPDLHLVSQARRHYFGKYGFNHEKKGVLVKLLQELARLRQVWRQDRKYKLVTMQLGDFFDVWREFASISGDKVPEESFGDLRDVLYRGQYRGVDCLKATMILGNHDTDLGEPFQGVDFMIKAFNRTENGKPFMFVTHGDAYSLLETVLPEVIKEIGVNFIGKLSPV